MSHVRLTHPTRATLEFRQGQQDDWQRDAATDITSEIGTDRPSLVHTKTRESTRTIRGTVSGLKRARESATSGARQALATYADELESHVDEFQGTGYTLVDDQLGYEKQGVLEGVEWSVTPGAVYDLSYEATVQVGRGTFEARTRTTRDPSVRDAMDVMLTVDGVALPGMLEYKVQRSVGVNVNAVFDRDTAENNDVVFEEGVQQTISFEGVHSGSLAEREQADAALDALVATKNAVPVVTKFPGYELSMFVVSYTSTLEEQRGGNSHRYQIELVEGVRA